MNIQWPVIANEHGDIIVLESCRDLVNRIEAIDVERDEYSFFDATGRALQSVVNEDGNVVLVVQEPTIRQPDRVIVLLVAYLNAVPSGRPPERKADESADSYLRRLLRTIVEMEAAPYPAQRTRLSGLVAVMKELFKRDS